MTNYYPREKQLFWIFHATDLHFSGGEKEEFPAFVRKSSNIDQLITPLSLRCAFCRSGNSIETWSVAHTHTQLHILHTAPSPIPLFFRVFFLHVPQTEVKTLLCGLKRRRVCGQTAEANRCLEICCLVARCLISITWRINIFNEYSAFFCEHPLGGSC